MERAGPGWLAVVKHCCCCSNLSGALQILQRRSELGMTIPRLLYTVPVGQNPTGLSSTSHVCTCRSTSQHFGAPAQAHACAFVSLPVSCKGDILCLSSWTLHANSNSSWNAAASLTDGNSITSRAWHVLFIGLLEGQLALPWQSLLVSIAAKHAPLAHLNGLPTTFAV